VETLNYYSMQSISGTDRGSSAVAEQVTHNHEFLGSNPGKRSKKNLNSSKVSSGNIKLLFNEDYFRNCHRQ
jgi:hypothetical protein